MQRAEDIMKEDLSIKWADISPLLNARVMLEYSIKDMVVEIETKEGKE
jgi:hypothetical protein